MDSRTVNRGNNSNRVVRKPLQETTATANNYSSPTPARYISKPQSPGHVENVKPQRYSHTREDSYSEGTRPKAFQSDAERHDDSHYSRISTVSPARPTPNPREPRKRKAQVGPWILGRTLGKGSSGRVRLAKHYETGQLVAIKIVGKGTDSGGVNTQGKVNTLPPGLEREVVIMKLISHNNVMGLWDVWENRGEL